MIPRFSWRNRLRLVLAILRGAVYVDHARHLAWGQTIRLRTVEDIDVIQEES